MKLSLAQQRLYGLAGKPKRKPAKTVPMVDMSCFNGPAGIMAYVPFRVLTVQWGTRGNRFAKADRTREFSALAAVALAGVKRPALPVTVTLTSIYNRRSMDPGNLAAALKGVEDVLADWLIPGLRPGMADGDPRLSFVFAQEKSPVVGLRVWIAPRGA